MEARIFRAGQGLAIVVALLFSASTLDNALGQGRMRQATREHVAHSPNFIVFASSPEWAKQVSLAAEKHRSELAVYWLGEELPAWQQRCPIHVNSGTGIGAAGETRFSLNRGSAGNWAMSVQGTPERVLDSVLPHEITHTIFATHFAPLGKYTPRWADEGACTTVEHVSERAKHEHFIKDFLRTGRGLAFNRMFSLKEYPDDILPLYAQGYSVVRFLVAQDDAKTFVKFLEDGIQTEAWEAALRKHYRYETIGQFQTLWNEWLRQGSPEKLIGYSPLLQAKQSATIQLASSSSVLPNTASQNTASPNTEHTSLPSSDPVSLAVAPSQNAASNMAWQPPSQLTLSAAGTPPQNSNAGLASNDDIGWYSRRLSEVSGGPATEIPPHNTGFRASPRANSQPVPTRAAAHPQAMQSTGVQVLDWGNSSPVRGLAPNSNPELERPSTVQPQSPINGLRPIMTNTGTHSN